MLDLGDLAYFVAAVEHGGFAAAARRLGQPRSTVSKRVAALEAALGVRLIQRTSRSFTLTGLGRDFHEHARAALIEAEAAQDLVRRRQAEPSGTVRITASVPTAQVLLAPRLPGLAARYPRLHLQVDVADRFVDVVQEGYDIAIRDHFAPLPDSDLVQRRIAVNPVLLVASPGYLDRRGVPAMPEDLAAHDGLLVAADATVWRLRDGEGRQAEVAPRARMTANESMVLAAAAEAGLGITCLPEKMCRDALADGRLARVLPAWTTGTVTTTLVMPHRRGQLPGVRAVVEDLAGIEAPASDPWPL